VGLVPAAGAVLAGMLLYGALMGASKMIDRILAALATLLRPVTRATGAGARSCGRLAARAMPSGLKHIARCAVAGWRAWENFLWTIYVGIRGVVRTVAGIMRFAASGVTRSARSTRRAAAVTCVTLGRGAKAGAAGTVSGFHLIVRGLDALGCAINDMIRLGFLATTFPVRLIARLLLRLSGSPPRRALQARR